MKQTISGTYIAEKHSIINNRVRKNAHTISGNKLTISILSATSIWTTIGRLFITSSPCPKLGGSYFPERQLWVSPGLAWEPYLRLLRAWTGAPLQPPRADNSKHPIDSQCQGGGLKQHPGRLAGDNRPQLQSNTRFSDYPASSFGKIPRKNGQGLVHKMRPCPLDACIRGRSRYLLG